MRNWQPLSEPLAAARRTVGRTVIGVLIAGALLAACEVNVPDKPAAPICETEANGSFVTADGPLTSGANYCGTYSGDTPDDGSTTLDLDFFRFGKSAGGTVTIDLTNAATGAQLALLDPSGTTKIGEDVTGPAFQIVCSGTNFCTGGLVGNANAAGTYYIRVVTTSAQAALGNYNLVVTYP